VARGLLYLVLAVLAIELVISGGAEEVDARGALHDLAHDSVGGVLVGVLFVGFLGFALWHVFVAVRGEDLPDRIADGGRALLYGFLAVLALSFLITEKSSGNSDQTGQSWTSKVLDWPAGPLLVGAVGLAVVGGGVYLIWRALSGQAQDESAVRDAAPRETPALHVLGAVGNVARGAVVALIGVFLVKAAIEHDPDDTVGLDGALKRLIDSSVGKAVVVLVAVGFALFGIYSIARAWINREAVRRQSQRG
jgi:hypothetical protein